MAGIRGPADLPGDELDPITVQLVEEQGTLVSDWRQAGRRQLLDGIQTVRQDRLARKMPWGEPSLEIPVVDLHFLKKANPDLESLDGEIKTKAWKKFLASPESLPYRVRGRGRNLNRSVGGI
jgi:hypothetical protein